MIRKNGSEHILKTTLTILTDGFELNSMLDLLVIAWIKRSYKATESADVSTDWGYSEDYLASKYFRTGY